MKTADPCSRLQIGLPSITNGAIAAAEANFLAVYGYDVRAEVFGSGGMVSAGDTALTGKTRHTATGRVKRTVRSDVELFRDAYAAEFASFVEPCAWARCRYATRIDARRALAVALACIESHRPVDLSASGGGTNDRALHGLRTRMTTRSVRPNLPRKVGCD